MQQKICRVKMAPLNWRSQSEKIVVALGGNVYFFLVLLFSFYCTPYLHLIKILKNIFESCFIANIVTSQAQKQAATEIKKIGIQMKEFSVAYFIVLNKNLKKRFPNRLLPN